MKVWQEN